MKTVKKMTPRRERLVSMRQGALEPLERLARLRVRGVELEPRPQLRSGLWVGGDQGVRAGEVEVDRRQAGIEGRGPAQRADRVRRAVLHKQQRTQIEVAERLSRIQGDGA